MPKTPKKDHDCSQRSPAKVKEPNTATLKASVKELAIQSSLVAGIEPSALERIKKLFQKANHPGTEQPEVDAAMLLAMKQMRHYNVSQAEILAHEDLNDRQKRAGKSIVTVNFPNVDVKKPVQEPGWLGPMARAIRKFFDCKSYISKRRYSVDVVFYGLAPNTVTAAEAFEIVFNKTLEWAKDVKGSKSKSSKYSYCLGVAQALNDMAEAEKSAEAKLACAPEGEHVDVQIGVEESAEDDEDEDMDDGIADGAGEEDEVDNRSMIERLMSPKRPTRQISKISSTGSPIKKQAVKQPKPVWTSSTQLATFRANADKIADEYLEEQEVKLKKGRKATAVKDVEAWKQGKADGKTIDVRGKRIEG
ncbi:hypothetical protein FKW77_002568 [Venturia effusa]|uniref:Uncharacterized protein n=1 Tax=Venturia effusa TaxID=50376 RepID=A0A517LNH8_9PEZI|nr:hypothetical protein FKW77_002568 [Venturia effusa]